MICLGISLKIILCDDRNRDYDARNQIENDVFWLNDKRLLAQPPTTPKHNLKPF